MWDQDPDKRAFVEAALAPLPPDEAARGMLEESVQVAGDWIEGGGGSEAREAGARMQASAAGYRMRRLVRRVLGLGVMLAIAWFMLFSPRALHSLRAMLASTQLSKEVVPRFVGKALLGDDAIEQMYREMVERFPPERRLLIGGDLAARTGPLQRWKPVWDQHPDDPAHFLVYAEAHLRSNGKWPEGFVETGERLAPGNGWFRLLGTMARGAGMVQPGTPGARGWGGRPATPAVPPSIKSGSDLAAILGDWDRALEMPQWDDYQAKLRTLRLSGWPQPRNQTELALSIALASGLPEGGSMFWKSSRGFGDFISALAGQYADSGDKEGLEALGERYVKTLERLEEDTPDFRQLLQQRFAVASAKGLGAAFGKLGDAARATPFNALGLRLDPKTLRPPGMISKDALAQGRGGMMAGYLGAQTFRVTPVEEKDLRGARLAEYAMTERLLMYAVVLLLSLVVLCVWLAGYRERRGPRELCGRLCGLLRPVDRLWILVLGVVLPWVMYVACLRLPWLKMRDFTLNEEHGLPMLALGYGLFLALVVCTVEAARWRLSRCGEIAGFGWSGFNPGRWIAIMTLMAMPAAVAGCKVFVHHSMDEERILLLLGSLGALPVLWILWICIGFFAGAGHRRLQRLTLGRAALPFMILAVLLAALAMSALHKEEEYWAHRIVYEAVSERNPVFNGGAGDAYLAWLQGEIREAVAELVRDLP
ncbi:hypothetical protein [Haloferula sp. BvORR071]|uniref:hypothetical protein n=1 Tax=Haloferula sp. BvORR071 TaxID=1396141 RepID=UPI000556D8F1|nr:hypothetical protein [Haloferula sp. BvORR071]